MSGITRRGFVKAAALAPLALAPLTTIARQSPAPERAAYLAKAGQL